ncbi:MAG: HAD family hydrolase [Pyrobaculum sp.]|uniref:HAD family hydrolase n=1 Tax=Pyrobaculum sp. TaxID=2004705 RepID=UPI003CB9860E
MRRDSSIQAEMNFITSFWGLVVERINFWDVWREIVDAHVVDEVAWVVEKIQSAGYEVPLGAVARALSHRSGLDHRFLAARFMDLVNRRMKPAPCVHEFFSALASRGRVAVLSNTPCRCFIDSFLKERNLHVDLVLTSDMLLRRKPSRSVFKFALSKLGAEPHSAVYIGDSVEDLGALGLGILTVIVGAEGGHLNFPDLCSAARWLSTGLERL